jgi:hypothetical protein
MPGSTVTQPEKKKQPVKVNPSPAVQHSPSGIASAVLTNAVIQRSRMAPHLLTPTDVLLLQRTIGNRAVQRLLTTDGARAPAPQAGIQVSPVQPGVVQRMSAVVRVETSGRMLERLPSGTAKEKGKQVATGAKPQKRYKKFETVEIDDNDNAHIKDEDGNIVWYHIISAPKALRVLDTAQKYIRASNIIPLGGRPRGDIDASDIKGETHGSRLEAVGKAFNETDAPMVEAQQHYYKRDERDELTGSDEKQTSILNPAEAAVWTVGSGIGLVTGIMGMASALKDLTDKKAGAHKKLDSLFDLISSGADYYGSGMGVMGGISSMVNQGSTEGTAQYANSEALSSWGFNFQSMFATLSSGIKTVKGVVDLIHMVHEEKTGSATHSRDEYVNAIGGLLISGLDTVRGVLVSIRQISQTVAGGIFDKFDQIIPGLDIAVAAVNIIMEGYYLIESAVHHWWMKKRKKQLKLELQNKGFGKDDIKQSRKVYSKQEASSANLDHQIARNEKKIAKKDKKIDKKINAIGSAKSNKKLGSQLTKLYAEQDEIERIKGNNSTLQGNKQAKQQEIEQYESETLDEFDFSGSEYSPSTGTGGIRAHPSRKDLTELDLADELAIANRKRIVRQSIHIGSNLVKIAGSITTLVAGPGAPAGVALKAAAAGIDLSLPLFRSLKQYGRKVAAKKQAKGETGRSSKVFNKIFNADKSTTAKLVHRKRQAMSIMMMVAGLNDYVPPKKTEKELKDQVKIVERYIRSAGITPSVLYKQNGNVPAQLKLLLEALYKRELG